MSCSICRTPNVIAADLAKDAVRRLNKEVAAYRARASGALSAQSAATHITRTVALCFFLLYGGLFLFGAVARARLTMS